MCIKFVKFYNNYFKNYINNNFLLNDLTIKLFYTIKA